uniref:Uncharacterized protein n=1 Tax=Vitis vinifera TaxID=29760 RepID=A5B0W1_VITVI|nr:hypothetical protein VITISV_032229 [Vitis vinifera]
MDVSVESKSLPSVGYSRKSYLQTTSQRLARDKLVHLNGWRSLALPSVGPGGLQRDFGDLDIKYLKKNISKYLKKNISKCRLHISGSFRKTPRHCAKWLRNSPGALSADPDMYDHGSRNASSPIRRQAPDAKYPDGMSTEQNSGCEISK